LLLLLQAPITQELPNLAKNSRFIIAKSIPLNRKQPNRKGAKARRKRKGMQEENPQMENRNMNQFTNVPSVVRSGCSALCVSQPSFSFAFPLRLCVFAVRFGFSLYITQVWVRLGPSPRRGMPA
jgi:hypothetical protein